MTFKKVFKTFKNIYILLTELNSLCNKHNKIMEFIFVDTTGKSKALIKFIREIEKT